MAKYLLPKTIAKKYAEAGLSQAKVDLLHKYFRCFSNLYGVISVGEAWGIFRHYEGIGLVRKREFIAFSGIVKREADQPFAVHELKEVYTGETTEDPVERLIVNREMILHGYHRFIYVYCTQRRQCGKEWYLPEKADFFAFEQDRFYKTEVGRRMRDWVNALKTTGMYLDMDGKPKGEILDVDGNRVAGKKLTDFVFYTDYEMFDIDYTKRETAKEVLRREYRTTAAEKVLSRIKRTLLTGGRMKDEYFTQEMNYHLRYIERDIGVSLSEKQVEKFVDLYADLNNYSHLWLNCGWTPDDLFHRGPSGLPSKFSVGPNMRRMFESGEMDRDAFEAELKKMGIELCD